jgi:hypothetical protein
MKQLDHRSSFVLHETRRCKSFFGWRSEQTERKVEVHIEDGPALRRQAEPDRFGRAMQRWWKRLQSFATWVIHHIQKSLGMDV